MKLAGEKEDAAFTASTVASDLHCCCRRSVTMAVERSHRSCLSPPKEEPLLLSIVTGEHTVVPLIARIMDRREQGYLFCCCCFVLLLEKRKETTIVDDVEECGSLQKRLTKKGKTR
ncbi:uncharacterized protein DS421_9g267770 [Arachis hypogaea]|nr:uncharacterized protein DS421_9g267770 [Arachis hypogaea]